MICQKCGLRPVWDYNDAEDYWLCICCYLKMLEEL